MAQIHHDMGWDIPMENFDPEEEDQPESVEYIQELWAKANSWRPIEHDPRGQQRIVTLIQVLEGSGQG